MGSSVRSAALSPFGLSLTLPWGGDGLGIHALVGPFDSVCINPGTICNLSVQSVENHNEDSEMQYFLTHQTIFIIFSINVKYVWYGTGWQIKYFILYLNLSLVQSCMNCTCTVQARTLYQKSDLCIPRNDSARPPSQSLHSFICGQFIYSQDQSGYFAAAKLVDRSWEYINRSQIIHECGNRETEHYNSVLEIKRPHSFIAGNT